MLANCRLQFGTAGAEQPDPACERAQTVVVRFQLSCELPQRLRA